MSRAIDPEKRFWAKVEKTEGCWLWTAKLDGGYGRFALTRRDFRLAHRVSYEWNVGPIADGMTIDHLCHTRDATCPGGPACLHRRCVRPDHLEVVTPRTNVLRAATVTGINAAKTHCDRGGHPLSGDNLYITSIGGRSCRACMRENFRRWYARRKEKRAALSKTVGQIVGAGR